MVRASRLPWLGSLIVLCGACGGRGPAPPTVTPAPPPATAQAAPQSPAQPPPAAPDPIAALIAASERHYAAGQRELGEGHLDQARREFDRAVAVLLESSAGARGDARLRDHYDRLIDRISAQEATALAKGDGFNEGPSEPAPIDELLAIASTFDVPATPTAETTAAVRADRAVHDIPIPLNDRVLGYIELFQGRLRDHIQGGMDRGAQYLPMIQEVFKAEGLPLDLAYIPLIESAFKPAAQSQKRARGVWQFMRATGEERGLETNWFVDERSDPEKSTRAAAQYLKWLYTQFGDWHLALASYNGGPGRVQRAMKRTGIEDFWRLADGRRKHLPRETREYVPLILAAMVVARNPTQYGFTPMATDKPYAYDTVTVNRAVDLRRIAEWTDTPLEQIQALNPELRRWTTPVRADRYDVKVPVGTGDKLRERLASAAPGDLAALHYYRVKRGESVATIARKLGVSRADLADANGLSTRSRVRAGQDLLVPRAPSTALVARAETAPEGRTARTASEPRTRTKTPARTGSAPKPAKVVYRVRRGDTLSSIARTFDTTVAAIKAANRLRSNRIAIGDRLTINRADASARARAADQ